MKTVLYLQHYPWRMWRERVSGIFRMARARGWRVEVAECSRDFATPREAIRFWRPDGCIVEGGLVADPFFDQKAFKGVPVVYCDADLERLTGPVSAVINDFREPGRRAAEEFISLGLGTCGFVGSLRPWAWSRVRGEVFAETLRQGGREVRILDLAGATDADEFFARLRAWLRELPKPCGVFGANDIVAHFVLDACMQERIPVPDEVAVLGVDNDRHICENTVPTLSSVEVAFEHSGYLAAGQLDGMMSRGAAPGEVVTTGVVRIVRRQSTVRCKRCDAAVLGALEYIRREACSGIDVPDVVERIGVSRRAAERRFSEAAGRTIGEAIAEVRIERAKELLREPGHPIGLVSAACGYGDDSTLRRAFKKATGLTLREWRSCSNDQTEDK